MTNAPWHVLIHSVGRGENPDWTRPTGSMSPRVEKMLTWDCDRAGKSENSVVLQVG